MARPLAMIAALGENRAIGIDNRLPWRLPADLKHFKAMTLDLPLRLAEFGACHRNEP
ncbi:dihydrofolate reductase, partial [Pseudomonas aeruginosa]|uniref:dihydrofolate reductase n=1 Tax=Pseudomonas aeruginosa TaxID=287 RepID=UPI003968749B